MKLGMMTAAAAGLTAAMTGAAAADCGVDSLIYPERLLNDNGQVYEPMAAFSTLESPSNLKKIEGILDNMVCQAWGSPTGSQMSLHEITSDNLDVVESLRRLAETSLITGSYQEMGSTGPVAMKSSSVHLSLSFNPLMSEKDNATAGLALLKNLIDRGISGEGTNIECTYANSQAQCTDKISIKLQP